MEIVFFIFLMIVPVISVSALILTMINAKRIRSLKKLTCDAISKSEISREDLKEMVLESI